MAKVFGAARLEAACERALEIGALNYGSIKSILDNRLEGRPINRRGEEVDQSHDLFHTNIRGSTYYH
ncbi:hypothetical protein [Asticcacaulis sp. W401b]|uniref:hypothetical protein n=1 Tax=Asticcacaulis sp. W401b TaxID=3388666 RepID=UPI0039710AB9